MNLNRPLPDAIKINVISLCGDLIGPRRAPWICFKDEVEQDPNTARIIRCARYKPVPAAKLTLVSVSEMYGDLYFLKPAD